MMSVSDMEKYVEKAGELYDEGNSVSEIAQLLGAPEAMVRVFLEEAGKKI